MNNIIKDFKYVVFKNYFNLNGRSRQSEYWHFVLAYFIISFILRVIESSIGINWGSDFITKNEIFVFSEVFGLLLLLPAISVAVRRLHDSNKSGWWILLPFYNLYLLIRKGSAGTNRFGPDPLTSATPIPPATPPEGQTA